MVIGKNPGNDNVYVVTGDSGNGMTINIEVDVMLIGLRMKHPFFKKDLVLSCSHPVIALSF
jgi:hypothetical protein